jgi:hypothetical protein
MLVVTGTLPVILRAEACRRPENREENLVAKNLPKNDFQKSSKVTAFQQENHSGHNPEILASQLCPIFTGISTVPVFGVPREILIFVTVG